MAKKKNNTIELLALLGFAGLGIYLYIDHKEKKKGSSSTEVQRQYIKDQISAGGESQNAKQDFLNKLKGLTQDEVEAVYTLFSNKEKAYADTKLSKLLQSLNERFGWFG